MKLYTVTIRGFKYYFYGDLTIDAINATEKFCRRLEVDGKADNATVSYERLINYIVSELGQSVTPITVEHIFRVNYSF